MHVAKKERIARPQIPVAKKEIPNHKRWWQTKNGCPNQASKQLHQIKETKQLKPHQDPKRLPTCKNTVERKKHTQHATKSQKTTVCNKGVDDYSHKSTEQK